MQTNKKNHNVSIRRSVCAGNIAIARKKIKKKKPSHNFTGTNRAGSFPMGRCSHRQTSRASLPVHGGCDDNTLSFVAGALCVSGIPHFARSSNSGHRVFRCFYCDPLGARAKSCLMWVCACVRVRQSLRRPQRTIVLQFLRSRRQKAIKMWDWSKNPADRFLSVSLYSAGASPVQCRCA